MVFSSNGDDEVSQIGETGSICVTDKAEIASDGPDFALGDLLHNALESLLKRKYPDCKKQAATAEQAQRTTEQGAAAGSKRKGEMERDADD